MEKKKPKICHAERNSLLNRGDGVVTTGKNASDMPCHTRNMLEYGMNACWTEDVTEV